MCQRQGRRLHCRHDNTITWLFMITDYVINKFKLFCFKLVTCYRTRQASTSKSAIFFLSLSQVLGHCDNEYSAPPRLSRPHPSTSITDDHLRCLRSFKTRRVPCDTNGCLSLERFAFAYLGVIWTLHTLTSQGGFARVYQVRDSRNTYLACKVVAKSSLKTKKAITKVRAHYVQPILNAETISALCRAPASGRNPSAAHRSISRQKCCSTPRTDTASKLTPGQSVSSSIPSTSVGRLCKLRTSKKCISRFHCYKSH